MKKTMFILILLIIVTAIYLWMQLQDFKLECQYKFGEESISYVTRDGHNSCTSKYGLIKMP